MVTTPIIFGALVPDKSGGRNMLVARNLPALRGFDSLFKSMSRDDFFGPMESVMDDLINGVLGEFPNAIKPSGGGRLYPKTDIYQKGDDLVFEACVPFVNKEDITAELDGNTLVVNGDTTKEEDDRKYFRKELRRSKFTRAFVLPEDVLSNYTNMDAEFKDGVLTIIFKNAYKLDEPPKPPKKIIDIK